MSDGFCLTLVLQALSQELDKDSPYKWTTVIDVQVAQVLKKAIHDNLGCAKINF